MTIDIRDELTQLTEAAVPAQRTDSEATADAEASAADMAELTALLATAGLDRVPTIEEAKALLDARREEIRTQVLLQADQREWCLDGTRQVCANLRLRRPDSRVNHTFDAEITLKVTLNAEAFTPEGALAKLGRTGYLSAQWFRGQLYNMVVHSTEVTPIEVNGQQIQLGDKKGEAA